MRMLTLFVLSLLWPMTALAARPLTVPQLVEAVEAPFRPGGPHSLRDLSAQFRQRSHIAALEQEQEAEGNLWLQFDPALAADGLPARFRWVYRQPAEQLFVSDGRTIWVWLPDNNQVLVTDTRKTPAQGADNPVTLLTALGNLSRDFTVERAGEGPAPGDYQLQLTPRTPSPFVSRILLTVDGAVAARPPVGAYFPLKGLTVEDEHGNRTEVSFHGVALNPAAAASLFRFDPPAGAEILRPEDLAPTN